MTTTGNCPLGRPCSVTMPDGTPNTSPGGRCGCGRPDKLGVCVVPPGKPT